ncbi:hypothetical protein CR492_20020 [Methylocella silvestris]|uniref:Uncharacterized protein n=1 Tax=Methylocella silvestris TaxID=199596 RepID=A0A2J7TBQ3_METSI|nr:hypothetical protein CR492_20020 [Methylocella silvestris]
MAGAVKIGYEGDAARSSPWQEPVSAFGFTAHAPTAQRGGLLHVDFGVELKRFKTARFLIDVDRTRCSPFATTSAETPAKAPKAIRWSANSDRL